MIVKTSRNFIRSSNSFSSQLEMTAQLSDGGHLARGEHSFALHTPPLAIHLLKVGARSRVGLVLARYKSNSKWVYLRLNQLNLQHLLHKIC